jgi:hypothetical protein
MSRNASSDLAECARCHFFYGHPGGTGDCHRYPPIFAGSDIPNERHRWKHPMVISHNWCGEFKPLAVAD